MKQSETQRPSLVWWIAVLLVSSAKKVMRTLKNTDTYVLDGQRIYYKHIRPHQGLNGKTPGQVAGLELDLGVNKWESLIKKAHAER